MKRITRGNSCFVSPPKIWGLYKWIIGLKDNVAYCYQRIKYGFCEADIWEMDTWFLKTIPAMLLHLKNSTLDYPEILEDPGCDMGFSISRKKKEKMSAPAMNLLIAAGVDVNAIITGAGESMIRSIKEAQ